MAQVGWEMEDAAFAVFERGDGEVAHRFLLLSDAGGLPGPIPIPSMRLQLRAVGNPDQVVRAKNAPDSYRSP